MKYFEIFHTFQRYADFFYNSNFFSFQPFLIIIHRFEPILTTLNN